MSVSIAALLADEALRRREFPAVEHKVYLAHAAVCPLAASVAGAMSDYLARAARGGQFEYLHAKAESGARTLAAAMIDASPDEIAFVSSTSAGLSLVAAGLPWRAGDSVVITYSGHGTWQPDEDGDEPDGRDEALCPHDLATQGPLLDDELFEIFSQAARGARVVFLSDSCHSGSVARMAPPREGSQRGRIRFLPPATFLSEDKAARARKVEKAPPRGLSRGTALLISGCKDTEYSYDASFGDRPNGAFTRAALDILPELSGGATYVDWHKAIRAVPPSSAYPQTPQLMASRSQRRWPVLAGA